MQRGNQGHSIGIGRLAGSFALLLVAVCGALGSAIAAQDIGFEGPSFSGDGSTPTESKPESKLWNNDGFWWGSLWNTSGAAFRIHRLDFGTHTWVDTGVLIDSRTGSHGDALWDGTKLYVESHLFSSTGGASGNPIVLRRYSYNTVTNAYSLDSGFPVNIGDFSNEATVIDKDSTGTLWAAWIQSLRVQIAHTLGSDTSWSAPMVLPTNTSNVTVDDICSLIRFGGNKIGVFWSDQAVNAYRFSVHTDGTADTSWSAVENATSGETDDHLNLAADSTGRVFAAGKNAANETLLLVRSAAGSWSRFVAFGSSPIFTRPIVLLNEGDQTIHVFATAQDTGEVREKVSSMSPISFPVGTGTIRMQDASVPFRISNPTSTKQNFSAATGLSVLAHHDTTQLYWHHDVLPALTASFTASPTSGNVPLLVQFTDTSTGLPTSWFWTFGDGGTSTAQNPAHTYNGTGMFTVGLTVDRGADEDSLSVPNMINATAQAPVAGFSADPTSGAAPLQVSFTDASTGQISSRSWSFGDGGSSTATNPTHTYNSGGTFTVSLTVTGPGGSDIETKTDLIVISGQPGAPVANFNASPTSGQAPLLVTFTDASTGDITSRSWSFGDGGSSTATNPTHTYAAGTFTVSLTVTGPGGSDIETKTNLINVSPGNPGSFALGIPVPGTAGIPNMLTVTGATPGARVGLYGSLHLGSGTVAPPPCPGGVLLGIRRPRLLKVQVAPGGTTTFNVTPPAALAGMTYHFQALDAAACSASNTVSEVF